jgi:membrane protein
MRINFKKIFAVVAILGIGVATFTPLTTYAVSGTDAQIVGGTGGVNKIDSSISQKVQDEANTMLTDDPDQVASILTTVLQNPKSALDSEQYRAVVNAFKNAPASVVQAVKNSKNLGKNVIATLQNNPELRKTLSQLFRDSGNFFENVNQLIDVRDNQGSGSQTVSSGVDGTPNVLQSTMYQTLLPSIIYSRSQASNSAGATVVSLADIEKYGVYVEGTNNHQRYGFVTKQNKTQPEGTKLANYLLALYHYDYLVPVPKDLNGGNPVSTFFNKVVRWATGTSVPEYTPSSIALGMAAFFGSIYDAATSFLKLVFEGVKSLNWNFIFGFTKEGQATGFIGSIIQTVSEKLGFSSGLLQALRYFIITIIFISFVIFVMVAMGARSRTRIRKGLINFVVRIVVIFVFIPVSGKFTDLIGEMASGITGDFTTPSRVNSMFVLDTLDWAATTNLSLAPITNASPSTNTLDIFKGTYEPTFDNVQKLTQSVIKRSEVAGLTTDKTSAADLLNKVSSREVVSVNAYFARVSSAQSVGSSSIAASNLPTNISSYRNPDGSDAKINIPFENIKPAFLSTKESSDDEEGSSSSDSSLAIYKWQVNSGSKDSLVELDSKAKMVVEPVRWYNLDTYIYGARLPDTMAKEHANYSNYINASGTSQLNDPRSGKAASDALKDSLVANANIIALYNQYAGVAKITPGGDPSLSTQTVAFLLQSEYSNGSLTYRGYNTIASKTGETKNTGVNGNAFVRYTIPNSGDTDLISKVFSLLTLWMCSAVVAVYALIWVLKGPIISTLLITGKSFLKAAVTGDITAAIKFVAGDAAIKFSATFAAVGTYMTLGIMGGIINAIQGLPTSYVNNNWVAKIPIVGDFISSVSALIGGMFICTLLTLALVWPIMRLNLGGRGKGKKPLYAGFLGIFIMIPYILFEALDEYLEIIYQRVYGKSRSRTFGAKLRNQADPIDQKKLAGNLAKNTATVAAKAGLATMTGGASTAVTSALGGAGATLAAQAGKTMLGAKSAANRFGGNMVDKVANFTGAPTGTGKDGMLRNLANGLKSNAAGLADEAGKVHVPTLAEAYQEHRDQNAFEKADNVEAIRRANRESGLSVSQRVENQYERDRIEKEKNRLIDADSATAIKNIDELAASLASAQASEDAKKETTEANGTYTPTGKTERTRKQVDGSQITAGNVKIQTQQVTAEGGSSTTIKADNSTLESVSRDGSMTGAPTTVQRDGSVAQAEQMAARLNQAVAGIEERINARKDVYVSDDERKRLDSSKAVANREAIMKMQTSMNETMKAFDETAQKLAKAHELRKSYENDQEKVDKIDKYINSLQSNNDNLKAKLTQITSVADKQLDRRVKLDIDNEKIASTIDKSLNTGFTGAMRHAATAISDLANNRDNAQALRDDWDRRVANKPESDADYQARMEKANTQNDAMSSELAQELVNEVRGLREESEYTNDLLLNEGIRR